MRKPRTRVMSTKKGEPVKSELGALIDGSDENIKFHCLDKDRGYVKGLEVLLTQTYNDLTKMKDALVAKMSTETLTKDSEEYLAYSGVIRNMGRIEHKIFILRDIYRKRSLNED